MPSSAGARNAAAVLAPILAAVALVAVVEGRLLVAAILAVATALEVTRVVGWPPR